MKDVTKDYVLDRDLQFTSGLNEQVNFEVNKSGLFMAKGDNKKVLLRYHLKKRQIQKQKIEDNKAKGKSKLYGKLAEIFTFLYFIFLLFLIYLLRIRHTKLQNRSRSSVYRRVM
ncbi:hypothetical protein [Fictibacillus sp. S7]|uniref:hypothetical protein n=1 Tax=Fictibacillus sp. S7 TaxID=2212476 RepID=UPI001F519E99|nr:hypothetical protein [Fictibacillus sp. S7]